MGLPMWRDPTMVDAPRATTTKSDPTASARSTIRRQRTIRSPNHNRTISSDMNERVAALNSRLDARRRRHSSSQQRRSSPEEHGPFRHIVEEIEASVATEGGRVLEAVDLDQPIRYITEEIEADRAREAASDRHRAEQDRAMLRDALSYERRLRHIRNPGVEQNSLRPVSPILYGLGNEPQADQRLNERTQYYTGRPRPTISHDPLVADGSNGVSSNATLVDGMGMHGSLLSSRPLPALTPSFAPAQHARPATRHGRREGSAQAPRLDLNELPPLRRVGNRSITDYARDPRRPRRERWTSATPRASVDGLGDRERSFSPGDDGDHWETMLTTITPDAQLPSAYSSFTSAAASASFSASNSVSNANTASSIDSAANTNITVPTSDEEADDPDNEPFVVCELSDTEDPGSPPGDLPPENASYDELRTYIRDRHHLLFGRPGAGDWRSSLNRSVPPNPPSPPTTHNSDNQRLLNRGPSDREVMSLPDELENQRRQRERDNENEMDEPHELRFMQRVLRGLTQREDIPDSWWAQVGLARTLRVEGEGATGAVAAAARL